MNLTEKEQAIDKQMHIAVILSNLVDINNTIIGAINFNNKTCFDYQKIKLEEEAKDLLEYIQKLGNKEEEN